MEVWISIFTILLGVIAATLPSFYKVSKEYRGKTRITKVGKIVATTIIALVGLQLYQIHLNEVQKLETSNEQLKKDKSNREFILRNNKSIITPFADGLRKYGLKYDTAKREIERIVRDSTRKVTVLRVDNPEFAPCLIENEQKGDTLKIVLSFCATQSAVYNLNAKCYAVSRGKNNKLKFLEEFPVNIKKITLDVPVGKRLGYLPQTDVFEKIYFLVIATFEDRNGKVFRSRDIVYSDPKAGLGFLTPKEEIWLNDFYQKNVQK